MKKIISAKQIFTFSNTHPKCRHLVIEDGWILETLDQLPDSIDYEYEHLSFPDQTLYPAFNDTHMHLVFYGAYLNRCQVDQVKSITQLQEKLAHYIDTTQETFISGRGWNHDEFEELRLPNRHDLDTVCSDRPVVLHRACGHISVVNSFALQKFNITSQTRIEGGAIDLENGEPTGILRENAQALVHQEMTHETIKKSILQAQKKLNAYGITSVQSDDLIAVPLAGHSALIELFKEMSANSELTIRIYQQAQFFTTENLKKQIESGYRQNEGDLFYKNGPLKILADGSLGARTAKLKGPYCDDALAKGILIHSEQELRALIECAHQNDIDVAVHGIGDYTIQYVVDQIAELQVKYPRKNNRNTIIHCQIMDAALIHKMADHKIGALVQPVFLEYDMTIAENRVGRSLAKTSYAYKTMLDSGIRLGFGSDAPVEDPNPFRSLYYATTRERLDGKTYFKEECISLDEALKAYTTEAATFSYEENIKGQLAAGFLADFIVVPQPLDSLSPKDLLHVKIDATFVGGTCVYKKNRPDDN